MLKIFRSIVLKQTKRVSLCFRGISASSYSHLNASFGLLTLVPSRYFATQKPHTSHISLLKNHHSYDGFSVSQFYIGCLSIYAYVISSGKDCFIVDPDNDVSVVEKFIKEHNFKVKGIFLSHYHADYVAGHHELMNKYHCKTYMGPVSKASENIVTLKDGELLKLGDATIKLIHTPGHTE